jgi:hypothetical protein
MLGQRLRLKTATIATSTEGPEKRIAVQLPPGAEIVVLDQIQPETPLNPTHQVNVEWDGNVISMFLVDILERGEQMPLRSKRKAVSDQ